MCALVATICGIEVNSDDVFHRSLIDLCPLGSKADLCSAKRHVRFTRVRRTIAEEFAAEFGAPRWDDLSVALAYAAITWTWKCDHSLCTEKSARVIRLQHFGTYP